MQYLTPIYRFERIREGAVKTRAKITSSCAAKKIARLLIEARNPIGEIFCVITLDTKHQPIASHEVTRGTLDASLVHPREVFFPAVHDLASAVLLVHNHPSGECEPSREDIQVTKQLDDAAKIMGITIIDHIIVGEGAQLSLREYMQTH